MTSQRYLVVSIMLLALACSRSDLEDSSGHHAGGGRAGAAGAAGAAAGAAGMAGVGGGGGQTGGSGGVMPCEVDQDCTDLDTCTTDLCDHGICRHGVRDEDGDGHLARVCGGDDCNDQNPAVYPGHPEDCTDGADNDCNGVKDCSDPACYFTGRCGCVPSPAGENCRNGRDDDCDTLVDCFDPDCRGTPACGCARDERGRCANGYDDDCDGRVDCADPDCAGDRACTCRMSPEVCTDGRDNDCDLMVDCADPDCAWRSPCVCVPPGQPENCQDGTDNDCNGLVDCADPVCLLSRYCTVCTQEVCNDGIDNDCDGLIDCADDACFLSPFCPPQWEVCDNGLDDDYDGKIDCADPDCATNPRCARRHENCLTALYIPGTGSYYGDTTGYPSYSKGSCGGDAGEAVFYLVLNAPSRLHVDSIGTQFDSMLYVRAGSCGEGREIGCDDDNGGIAWSAKLDFPLLDPGTYYIFLDGFTVDPDPQLGADEGPYQLNVEVTPNPGEVCTDGADNDGDHLADCADPDCARAPNCVACAAGRPPSREYGPSACTDGVDNDCDGLVDCRDSDCHASDYYVAECCDGDDDNGNGIIDDFSCRCASSADCQYQQICYTHSVWACGIPCDSFVGDICPFIVPGSRCNPATQQCEF